MTRGCALQGVCVGGSQNPPGGLSDGSGSEGPLLGPPQLLCMSPASQGSVYLEMQGCGQGRRGRKGEGRGPLPGEEVASGDRKEVAF